MYIQYNLLFIIFLFAFLWVCVCVAAYFELWVFCFAEFFLWGGDFLLVSLVACKKNAAGGLFKMARGANAYDLRIMDACLNVDTVAFKFFYLYH